MGRAVPLFERTNSYPARHLLRLHGRMPEREEDRAHTP